MPFVRSFAVWRGFSSKPRRCCYRKSSGRTIHLGVSMNWKAWAPLAVAAVLGLIAAKIALDMTNKNKGQADPASKLAKVVVAKEAIIPGATLREEDLVLSPLATEQAP